MKTKLFALALMLTVVGSAIAANPRTQRKNSRQEMGINGNALYVIEYTYDIHGAKGSRQLVCIDSIVFDKRGNYQDKIRRKQGEYTWFSYYFDVNGYALGWNEYDRANTLNARTAYLNDKNGNRIERTIFRGMDKMFKRETSHYENNRLVEEQSFDENGRMTETRLFKYDNQGNNTELEFYDRNGDLQQRYLYKYDNNGNRIEWRYYDADEFLVALTTYYYDDHNNAIEVSSFNYDEHLNWKHSYIYEYDEDDNWVRQTIYRNGTPYQVIEREIAFPAD